eukprot:GFKZ01008614.1.p1 GENE.GFKZ01008614.1~~GFKZ01008614.1.p1  ORF type:complete len:379 (-),score=33.73 GFKZ01008614.1:2457-3593(-)
MPDAVLPYPVTQSSLRKIARHARRWWFRFAHDQRAHAALTGVIFGFTVVWALGGLGQSKYHTVHTLRSSSSNSDEYEKSQISLFIAIGSAPQNSELRAAARDGWLQWLPDDNSVKFRFFTDEIRMDNHVKRSKPNAASSNLIQESEQYGDIVFQPLPSGYGDSEHNLYALRARYQAKWALEHIESFAFYLRIDDDSFLCLNKLIYELKALPREQFFWGRFWCREGRNRADENFMLFSHDVVQLLADDTVVGRLIPFDNEVTLGWNFGYWSWVLNLTIFDDQKRLDAQQGNLTEYMHLDPPAEEYTLRQFCEDFLYAHHVKPGTMRKTFVATRTHFMYELPERKDPSETCDKAVQSFVPARHSRTLPDLLIGRSVNGFA